MLSPRPKTRASARASVSAIGWVWAVPPTLLNRVDKVGQSQRVDHGSSERGLRAQRVGEGDGVGDGAGERRL